MRIISVKVFSIIKSRIFGSFSSLLISQAIFSICSFIIGIFCSRYYGPTLMGEYNYSVSFTYLFTSILIMGLESVSIKDLSQKKEHGFGSLLTVFIIGQTVAILLCLITTFLLGLDKQKVFYNILLCLPWFVNFLIIFKHYQIAKSRLKYYSMLYIISTLLFTIIKILLIVGGGTIKIFALVVCIETFVSFICMYASFKMERIEAVSRKVDWNSVRSYIKIGIPFTVSALSVTAYMKIDQLMVGNMIGDRELGIYSLTVSLSECWYIIPTALYTAMLPSLSIAYAENKNVKEKMQKLADYLALIGYAAIVGVLVFGKLLVPVLYGEEYLKVTNLMIVYVIAGFFVSIGFMFSAYFAIKEKSVYSMVRTMIGCVVNIVLNWILIQQIGSMGAVVATVITQFITGIVINAIVGIRDKELMQLVIIELKALFPFVRLVKAIKSI